MNKYLRIGVKDTTDEPGDIILTGPPRCGNHWLKYIVEFLAEGKKVRWGHIIGEPIWHTAPLILILRNYKECITRHACISYSGENFKVLDRFNFILDREIGTNLNLAPLRLYDGWNNRKMIIYYEDFILNPSDELNKIAKFLSLSIFRLNEFLDNFEYHRMISIENYDKQLKSVTKGSKDFEFHSRQYPVDLKCKIDDLVMSKLGNLYKYLERYKEEESYAYV